MNTTVHDTKGPVRPIALFCFVLLSYLGLRVAKTGPAVGLLGLGVHQHVFLLDTEPGLGISVGVHDLLAGVAMVGLVGSAVRVVGLAKHKLVITAAEGISEQSNGNDEDIRVVALGLAGGGTIVVPLGQISSRLGNLVDSLGLATEVVEAIDPDVLDLDLALGVEVEVLLKKLSVGHGGHCIKCESRGEVGDERV